MCRRRDASERAAQLPDGIGLSGGVVEVVGFFLALEIEQTDAARFQRGDPVSGASGVLFRLALGVEAQTARSQIEGMLGLGRFRFRRSLEDQVMA